MDQQLSEKLERVRAHLEAREKEAGMDTSTNDQKRPQNKQEALGALFQSRVPERYWVCRPEHVPELGSILYANLDTGVFFQGEPGTGKTYAATALAWRYIDAKSEPQVHPIHGHPIYAPKTLTWVPSTELLYRIRSTYNRKTGETYRDIIDEMTQASVLVLDDLGAEKTTDHAAEVLYAIISGRINHCRFTIVTTNMTFGDIEAWKPSIASRLAGMVRVDLPNVDRRLSQ